MTVKAVTYSQWNTVISTRNIVHVKNWKQFAADRGTTLEKGEKEFTIEVGGMKVKYTRQ